MDAAFSNEELLRYSRHLVLPEVGAEGQARLKKARILLVGAGGLGSPAAMYLAAAGVGGIGLVDHDIVELSNLQRQVIHGDPDLGRSKLDSAAQAISAINPHVAVEKHEAMLTAANALKIIEQYDLVIDGTDNFPTRYLVNDACIFLKKPNFYGSVFRFEGQATVFCMPEGPCYRCLFPEPPPPGAAPSCAEGGVLGVLPGLIGLIQSTEAVKYVLGVGTSLVGRLLLYDALGMRFTELHIRRDPACPVCGDHPSIRDLIDYEAFCGVPKFLDEPVGDEIGVGELSRMISAKEEFNLIDVREPNEYAIVSIEGSILIPLGQVPSRLSELDPHRKTVVHCQSGMRSSKACQLLRDANFETVYNLKGGIEAWLTKTK